MVILNRPYIILNCAMSLDGKIALKTKIQTKISNNIDIARVQRLRGTVDGILVGIGTVLSDDPELLAKGSKKNPVRIVLDSKLRIPFNAKVLNDKSKTIIVTTENSILKNDLNCEIIVCGKTRVDLNKLMYILQQRNIHRLLVEGGATVNYSFLKNGLFDELNVFVGSMIIGGNAPTLANGEGANKYEEIIPIKLISAEVLDNGVLLKYVK